VKYDLLGPVVSGTRHYSIAPEKQSLIWEPRKCRIDQIQAGAAYSLDRNTGSFLAISLNSMMEII